MKHPRLALATLAFVLACDAPSAKSPTARASAAPLPLPGFDPPDAAPLDIGPATSDAGHRSDCLPETTNDGDAESATLSGDTLTVCLRFSQANPQATGGRICYDVNLGTGVYARVPSVEVHKEPRALARHPAAAAPDTTIVSGAGDVQVCHPAASCEVVRPASWKPLRPGTGESCLPEGLRSALPADVSPDGSRVFVVRHESCTMGMAVYGETYDVKSKRRLARAPLRVDEMITYVAWIGKRVVLRDCNEDKNVCSVSLLNPGAPPPATQTTASWNGPAVPDVNPGGLERFVLPASGDLWALVDRTGGQIALVHSETGKVERTVTLPAAPALREPLVLGPSRTPQELFLFYGGTGRVILFDLASGQATKSFLPPLCGYDRGVP